MRWPTAAAAMATAFAAVGAALPLRTVARVPLPGPSVRFDYASLDAGTNRLWIAHMDAGKLLALDVRTRRVVATIAAPGVHGVLAVPRLHRVYASATDAHEVLTIDARTGAVLARAPAGRYPDGIAYDPVERRVFVSDETGGLETVLDARGRRVATIALGGEAGNVQYDAGAHRVLVDVQTRNEVAVVDPRRNRVVRRVRLAGCEHDHGLLVDAARRLAFVACDGNARLLTLDLRTLKVTASASVGASPDVLAFDPSLRRLYAAAESGDVAVFAEDAHRLTKLAQAHVAPAAHTVAVDPRTHLVYFPLERGSSGRPELLIMAPSRTAPAHDEPTGDPLRVEPGAQLSPGPWKQLARAASARAGAAAATRGFLQTPNALAFTVTAAPAGPVRIVWSVYCEGYENDVIFNRQGAVTVGAPASGYPEIMSDATKCFLTLRATPAAGAKVVAAVFGS